MWSPALRTRGHVSPTPSEQPSGAGPTLPGAGPTAGLRPLAHRALPCPRPLALPRDAKGLGGRRSVDTTWTSPSITLSALRSVPLGHGVAHRKTGSHGFADSPPRASTWDSLRLRSPRPTFSPDSSSADAALRGFSGSGPARPRNGPRCL